MAEQIELHRLKALVGFIAVICSSSAISRSPLQQDVEGYAIATCLGMQSSPFLKNQADGWGSIIVQRGHGPREPMLALSKAVRAEVAKAPVYIIRSEEPQVHDALMPVAYCAEIIDHPRVRFAIIRASKALVSAYTVHKK